MPFASVWFAVTAPSWVSPIVTAKSDSAGVLSFSSTVPVTSATVSFSVTVTPRSAVTFTVRSTVPATNSVLPNGGFTSISAWPRISTPGSPGVVSKRPSLFVFPLAPPKPAPVVVLRWPTLTCAFSTGSPLSSTTVTFRSKAAGSVTFPRSRGPAPTATERTDRTSGESSSTPVTNSPSGSPWK